MDPYHTFKAKLALLDNMLSKMNVKHQRMQQLRRSVYVLRHLLNSKEAIKSPYGPTTPIVRFSLQ